MAEQTVSADDFSAMVAPCWPAVVGLANRLCGDFDGDDVAQEALAAAWRDRGRYDPDRGSVQAWLLMLTAEHARRLMRKRLRQPAGTLPNFDVPVSESLPDWDLRRAVANLSERQQLAVALFYYLDLPVDEVAAVMACSAGTVKSTLADARRRLGEQLCDTKDS